MSTLVSIAFRPCSFFDEAKKLILLSFTKYYKSELVNIWPGVLVASTVDRENVIIK